MPERPRVRRVAATPPGRAAHAIAADELRVERRGPVARLSIGRPGAVVRLTARLHAELAAAVEEIDHDEAVRAVVLESRGRAFCLGDANDAPPPGAGADGVAALARLRVPVVALLQGDALDAGLELALACDLRLAATTARLGLTQVARGALPVRGGTQRLPRVVGRARAIHLLLLGEPIAASRAKEIGLVHEVVAAGRLAAAGRALATRLAARGPIAQRFAKEALLAAGDLPLAEGLRLEGDLYVLLQATRDRDEGLASFRDRRTPQYTGR